MQNPLDIRLQMARQQLQSGQLDQAEYIIGQVLAQDPDNAAAAGVLAMVHMHRHEFALAIETLDQACARAPTDHATLIQIATIYKNLGRFDRAKACYRRCIELHPEAMAQGYLNLATTCRYSDYDDDVRAMEAAHATTTPNSLARRYLSFALGKVFDDLKDYDRAFDYFHEGNQIASTSMPPMNMESAEGFHRKIRDRMDAAFFNRHEHAGISDNTPIIVTGLPRSGTTLVEQILASHSQVFGGGETQQLTAIVNGAGQENSTHAPFPDNIDLLGPVEFQDMATKYIASLKSIGGDRPRITDKSIFNYLFIGLIRVMLPNAKVIICRRDVRDMGLSLYQKDLGGAYSWSYDLDQIRRFYGYFDNLTQHWTEHLPDNVFTIQYEDLIADPEHHIRALLTHCDLDFEPECLAFYDTDRVVMTESRDQVRRPIYKSAVGRWKHYRQHLGPLMAE